MNIKKVLVCLGIACMFGMGTASAAEAPNAGKFGLGYEGVFAGSVLQGLSGRYWINNKVGTELNLFYGNANISTSGAGLLGVNKLGGDLFLGTAKVMYAPIVKSHSKFYVGLEGGVGSMSLNANGQNTPGDIRVYVLNPLIGSEFHFSEFPELGFNFEVGYKFHDITYKNDPSFTSATINLNGIGVALGAHYYF